MINTTDFLKALRGTLLCFGLGAATLLTPKAEAQSLPPAPDPTCKVPPAEFASWFEAGAPMLNGPVIEADSLTLDTSLNCNFYKWSSQMLLWLLSPASGEYQGNHVFDSQIFYQVQGSTLVAQGSGDAVTLAVRSAQSGANGLQVIVNRDGDLKEFVSAVIDGKKGMLVGSANSDPVRVASVQRADDGTAIFLNAKGKVLDLVPLVTAAMVPESALPRLEAMMAAGTKRSATLAERKRAVAKFLNAAHVLIRFGSDNDAVFVQASTNIIENLEVGQAGGNGVLIAQNGSIIFYETIVNDVYAWYLTGRKTSGGISPIYVNGVPGTYGYFPTTQNELDDVLNYAASRGVPPGDFLDARALAVEAKLSWVEASTLPNPQDYVVTEAIIPVFDRSSPTIWKMTGTTQTKVALVGVHVVGSTAEHPEMVWATFEHKGNTPDAVYQYNSGGTTLTVPQDTSGSWLFTSSGSTGPFNTELAAYDSASSSIQAQTSAAIGPSDILRQKAWGSGYNGQPNQEDLTPAAANTQVISLNTDVVDQLTAAGAIDDPRINYWLIGATWTWRGASPNGRFPLNPALFNEIGTSTLTNSTMETFQQGADPTIQTGTNCFTCHADYTLTGARSSVSVSHIFAPLDPL